MPDGLCVGECDGAMVGTGVTGSLVGELVRHTHGWKPIPSLMQACAPSEPDGHGQRTVTPGTHVLEGELEGGLVGGSVGGMVGESVGEKEGMPVGPREGVCVGLGVGAIVGVALGCGEGANEGGAVGGTDGTGVGG